MKEKFYSFLHEVKYQSEYYKIYLESSVRFERIITCFLATMSVGALGVAWGRKDTGIIPISLICISQVISAVKPHLPYNTRIKELSKIIGQYDYMFNELENYYNCINNKTDDMIMQELNKYKRIRSDFQHNCLPNDTLPYNKKFADRALEYANNYFDI